MVIWLIGMSGAGKTTVGRALYELWRQREPNTIFVDGDEVRSLFSQVPHAEPYSVEGRRSNAERMTELCCWLDRQEMNVVCCILSIFDEMRQLNRQRFSNYFEVYLHAPLDVMVQRDKKNIYAPALRGERKNVVGLDIPFKQPTDSDLVIDNSQDGIDATAVAKSILHRAVRSREAMLQTV